MNEDKNDEISPRKSGCIYCGGIDCNCEYFIFG